MSTSGGSAGEQRLPAFALSIAEKSKEIIDLHARSTELVERLKNPIRFRAPGIGGAVFGYEATVLADLCDVVLAARAANKLQRQQEHIASVVTAMKLSSDYPDFIGKLNRIHPRFGDTASLDLEDDDK